MKQVILIHGRPDTEEFNDPKTPSPSNTHWFPWIQKQLAMNEVVCQSLEFPFKGYDPIYDGWVAVIENFKIDQDTILVGHSTGGGFILRYLAEHPNIRPGKIILVAPWLDPRNILKNDFMKFDLDPALAQRTDIHGFISSDDMKSVVESVSIIKDKIPGIHWYEFTDREHFCDQEFPELLALLT